MFKIVKSDYIIEYTMADAYNGPDGRGGGLNVNSGATWVRIDGGEWFRSECRSMHIVRTFIENYNGPKEQILAELIKGEFQWQRK